MVTPEKPKKKHARSKTEFVTLRPSGNSGWQWNIHQFNPMCLPFKYPCIADVPASQVWFPKAVSHLLVLAAISWGE